MNGAGLLRRGNQWTARHPAVAAMLPFVTGILFARVLPPTPWLWLAFVAGLLATAIIFRRAGSWVTLCIASSIFLIGLTAAQLEIYFYSPADIGAFASTQPHPAELELRLDAAPRTSRQWIDAQVLAIQTTAGRQNATGRVTISGESPYAALEPGQTIQAYGWLAQPPDAGNPGQLDPAQFDRARRILAEFRVKQNGPVHILSDAGPTPLARLQMTVRNWLNDGFDPAGTDPALLRGLVLGDADPSIDPIRHEFDITGTAYLFSTSGMHIAIIGGFVVLLMRLARQPPRTTIWVMIVFMTVAVAAIVPSESGIRALLMSAAATLGLLCGRRAQGLQLLAIAAMILLLVHPLDLFTAGFQIGAVAVLALILFSGRLPAFAIFVREGLDAPPPESSRNRLSRIAIRIVRQRIWNAIAGSIIAWIAVAPVLAYHFQQFGPWTVPGGVLMFPLTVIALIGGVLKILLTATLPPLAGFWAWCAAIPIHWLHGAVDLLAKLPGAALPITPPPAWVIVMYYALMLLPLIPWRRAITHGAAQVAPFAACIALPLLPLAAPGPTAYPDDGSVYLTLLSVDNGQSALLQTSHGQYDVFDCDAFASYADFPRIIQPYLRYRGIRAVEGIFVQHGSFDNLVTAGQIRQALDNPDTHTLKNPLKTGDRIEVDGGVVEVIWADPRDRVLRLTIAGKSILFAGDITTTVEQALSRHPEPLTSDILIAPRHGSAEASTPAFLRAVNPKFIICSSAADLTAKQRAFDQIAQRWPIYRAGRSGTIDVTLRPDGQIKVRTFFR